jgi:HD-GYP domain-containing protein (c-di-GMP phosphodiesterase class II)
MDPEEMVVVFRNLEDTIRELPSMAEQVKEIEVLFIRLMTLHEELSSFGKNVIPPEDLSQMLFMVQDEIPRLWATGSWEKLRKCISDVKSFIKHYDLPIRTELSTAERKKPTGAGMTRAILTGSNSLPFSEAIHLIRSMVSAVDSRDPFMRGHSDTVARLSKQMAGRMNWSSEEQDSLDAAALLHDVGKIMVPESVLTKPDALTPEEWKSIQTHPMHGARILKPLTSLSKIIPWIYHHQERWDGTGYPDGLQGEAIPFLSRIIAVADGFEAMTSDRAFREKMTFSEAIEELRRCVGTHYSEEIVDALIEALDAGAIEFEKPAA